ncbi:MAG: hypothetical protein ACE5JM_00635, partial [Armatimonadota bacterium]
LADGEGDPRGKRTVKVTDNLGREAQRMSAWPGAGRGLWLFRFPEANAAALTIDVATEFAGYGDPVVFEHLAPMDPAVGDGVAVMLGALKLTEEWIPPTATGAEPMAPGEPPYLLARLYALPTGPRSARFHMARPVGGGPRLALRSRISYRMAPWRFACPLRTVQDAAGNELTRMLPNRYGPAWMAGIQREDILLNCDGVTGKSNVLRYIREQPPGAELMVWLRRGGVEMDVPLVLDEWEPEFAAEAQTAMLSLLLLAEEATEGVPLMCYELQSAGDHGAIPLPAALSASLSPYVEEALGPVTLENVPLP